ncbi:MAG: 5-oxoprolinase subunit PxpA [Fimbriimonas sp.]
MRVSDVVGRRRIDLNVDIGEGFPFDADLLRFASSANVCCGAHAGSQEILEETLALCRKARVRIGAHPGYPDRLTMGRRSMELGEQTVYLRSIFDQLQTFAKLEAFAYIKPHGAFYNDTAAVLPHDWNLPNPAKRQTPYEAGGHFLSLLPGGGSLGMLLRLYQVPLLGLASTAHAVIAERAKVELISEGFADRAMRPDGTLVPRGEPGAVLTDPNDIRQQVLRLAESVDSICLHGDTPGCVEMAELVVSTLVDAGYEVAA